MAWYNFGKIEESKPTEEVGNYSSYDGSRAKPLNMSITEDKTKGIYMFGRNNNYPKSLIELYDKSPTHQAIINRTALMIAGDGFEVDVRSEELIDRVHTKMLIDFPNLKENLTQILSKVGRDIKLHGRFGIECIWNEEHDRVVEMKHVDAGGIRVGIMDDGEVPFYKFSENWNDNNFETITYMPFSRIGEGNRQMLYVQFLRSGHLYYGLPDYYASINWIESEAGIGEAQADSIANGFSPKVAVVFPAKPESVEIEKKTMDNLNKTYSGTRGKKIMGIFSPRPELKPEIQALNIDNLHKQYQEVDAQTQSKILTGHGVVSKTLFGIDSTNGLSSNTDELKMAYNIYQKTVVGPYQQVLEDSINRIFRESDNGNRIKIVPYSIGI